MTDKIVTIAITDDVWTEENPRPRPSALITTNGTDNAYLSHSSADWSGVTHAVIGEWGDDGEPLLPIDPAYEAWIVAGQFKNDDNGMATGPQHSMRWQGHSEHKFYEYDDTDPEAVVVEDYPSANRPYEIKAEWFLQGGTWPGWYIRFTLTLPTGDRDPSVRSISVYDAGWNYLYNLGAWTLTDPEGNYYMDIPAGQQYPDKVDVNYAATWAAAIEGKMTLPLDQDEVTRLFWQSDA